MTSSYAGGSSLVQHLNTQKCTEMAANLPAGMRRRLSLPLLAFTFICFCLFSIRRQPAGPQISEWPQALKAPQPRDTSHAQNRLQSEDEDAQLQSQWVNTPSGTPKKSRGPATHPIQDLINDAQREFKTMKSRQSKTLKDAVAEYRKRYGMPPPPNFDKWFEYATKNNVQLVDEFDTVYDMIAPFWGLKPKTIRERAKEAIGGDNFLIKVGIRNHRIALLEEGQEWQRNATVGMLEKFVQYLPDMDLAFNIHDEPRVVVPHDDMTRLLATAKDKNMPAANAVKSPVNDFSPTAAELSNGLAFEETKVTRFNVLSRQPTWTHSRMPCSPNSPARVLEEEDQVDYLSEYGYSDLGFVYNTTAMSDICLSPSVSTSHGFFDVPNSYNIVHDLFPIFSQSKISSYADLVYPSPWYWYGKVTYDEEDDMAWEEKQAQLYWRGSTTGGYSRNGAWRRQHRQRFVQKINGREDAKVFANQGSTADPAWEVNQISRAEHRDLLNVTFSHIGQCDPGDCNAEVNFFEPTVNSEQHAAWGYKYLLDMDGNAFSGRFYAFLQSRSLVFKMALFREWHNGWLKPWLHYVPLSLQGADWLEAVRYFALDNQGKAEAERMAEESREWANKAVRNEDMEAWFFRLLLE